MYGEREAAKNQRQGRRKDILGPSGHMRSIVNLTVFGSVWF